MKKRIIWNLISLVIAIAIFAIMQLTGNWGNSPEKISETLAIGELDIIFKGTVSQKYIDILSEKRTAETIKETHKQDVKSEIEYFFKYFGFDEEIMTQKQDELIQAFDRIYSNAEYKMVKSEKKGTGVAVSIEMNPINTLIEAEDEFEKVLENMKKEVESGKVDGTDDELTKEYTNRCLEKFFELSKGEINHQDPRTITLNVNKLNTGHYQVDTKSLSNIIAEVVPYKSK